MTGGSQRQHFEVQRQKAHLEGVLEVTRKELEETGAERAELRQQRDALTAEAVLLRGRARDLDAQLVEARARQETLAAEAAAARDELRQSEVAACAGRQELEQSRRDAEGREATIAALKTKVAELVVEAQQRLQERLRAESAGQAAREELEQRERSRDWYRSQLKASQEAHLQQQQELMAAQTELLTQRSGAERLRGELALARQAAASSQARAVREKESLMRHLENIRADILQRETYFQTMKQSRAGPSVSAASSQELDEAKAKVRSLELTVGELKQQLEKSAEDLAAAASANAQLEKAGLASRLALAECQEKLSQQSNQSETLKLRCQEGTQVLDQLRAQVKEGAAARQALTEQKTRLEVALASANQEKRDVDDAARGLSNELKKMSASFYKLKNNAGSKDKQLDELRESLSARESELRACSDKLEEASRLQVQADQMADKMSIFDKMNEQNKQLMVQNHELRYKVQQLTQDRAVLDQGRLKLEEVVRNLQCQVNDSVQREANAKASLDERNSRIRDLEDQDEKSKQELVAVKTYARTLHQSSREDDQKPAIGQDASDIAETAPVVEGDAPRGRADVPNQDAATEPADELRHQVSLLSVQNRELERRLQLAAQASGAQSAAQEDADRLRQENAALSQQLAALTQQLRRHQQDAENERRAAAAGYKERHRCYQSNIRVLTRKLREYMRALKTAERELAERRRDAQRARQEGEELRARADDAQLLSLEVEKERGRLEGMAQSYTALQRRAAELEALLAGYEEQRLAACSPSGATPPV
ncbi:golgin subfamily A member 3-like [Pollicipes pollicipes]|uniref:golgin subfamily A member 3-like n=1 Tax=Pollicipes pollicipes TaxID=41117 RepID=UPI001884900A|nr:golgin subfamily A member 3-like [Pollicipes pollicipes]